MTDLDLVAAEYVLGTLPEAERNRLDGRIARDAELRAAVRRWERRVPLFDGDTAPSVTPSDGLWDRISAAVAPRNPSVTRAADGEWESRAPGVERKTLFVDSAAGVGAYLFRLAPGAILREHGHRKVEQCLMLEGDVSFAEVHLKAGDFHMAFSGATHADITSRDGALFFIRGAAS